MIKPIDEMLRTWAAELHPPNGVGSAGNANGGSNVIAMLMATRGNLTRSTAGARCPLDRTADIELIVNKHLPPPIERVVRLHYTDYDMSDPMKWAACGCGKRQYYRRLDLAHAAIAEILLRRAA
ncbi:hypothetical protein MRQ32_028865 [Pseudomonas aeruginosa]|uniref:PA0613 family protein n=1 Tax=Pseudomonas aeruginosa TaxID=287 RepID=UPI001A1F5DCF|nr:hypothetical protein [Pseudomonas aeruginosa]MBI7132015.1 hypothetical protein [Pseudomonas aeruginosa]MBU5922070.1 hypothetical protein [Pseudomonas aeruginosa]MBU5954618.1 hypothetical protein [Pseudomonas aeruginosa]MCJ2348548.1 hypothetical protein [Pseudomonas aeruginosa]MCJ2364999.1 hypothetical protein [Pseudomonas aeruginosa]